MKLLGLPGDRGPCYLYRIGWPFQALEEAGLAETLVPAVDEEGKCEIPFQLTKNYDLIIFQRQHTDAIYGLTRRIQAEGGKVVFDIDDSVLSIPTWNPCYLQWGRDKQAIKRWWFRAKQTKKAQKWIEDTPEATARKAKKARAKLLRNIGSADLVTVTTEQLRKEYSLYNSNTRVLPNQIRLAEWEEIKPIPHKELWIGWAGGPTHSRDLRILYAPLEEMLRRYSDLKLVFVGIKNVGRSLFPEFPQERLFVRGWLGEKEYKKVLASCDIVLAPSEKCNFNRAKSDIRVLEAWTAERPVVASPTTYKVAVQESGGGFIAKNTKDWLKYLIRLVENPKLRKEMGKLGRQYVLEKRNYSANIELWYRTYSELINGG